MYLAIYGDMFKYLSLSYIVIISWVFFLSKIVFVRLQCVKSWKTKAHFNRSIHSNNVPKLLFRIKWRKLYNFEKCFFIQSLSLFEVGMLTRQSPISSTIGGFIQYHMATLPYKDPTFMITALAYRNYWRDNKLYRAHNIWAHTRFYAYR